jgi:flagellar motor switch protein FliN/FliY
MADGPGLGPEELERLLKQAQAAPRLLNPPAVPAGFAGAPSDARLAQGDVELLLKQAEQALASVENRPGDPPPGARAYQLEDFVGANSNGDRATLDLIRDVELDLRIEFGRTHMYLEDILKLRKGSVVPLDKLAGEPVEIFVNGRLIAKGEVLVLNDNFCVRVAELIAGSAVAA